MPETKFDICSRALNRVGCNAITSFDDGATESIVAGREYEATLEALLTDYPWGFAGAQFVLNKLVDTPVGRWSVAYQMPDGVLTLRAVTVGGQPIPYAIFDDKIYTDWDDDLVADYTTRPDETRFPPYFRDALVARLEAIFMRAIKRNQEAAENLDKLADRAKAIAKNTDGKQRTTRRVVASRLAGIRPAGFYSSR